MMISWSVFPPYSNIWWGRGRGVADWEPPSRVESCKGLHSCNHRLPANAWPR